VKKLEWVGVTGSYAFIASVLLFTLKKVFDIDRKVAELCTKIKYIEKALNNNDKDKKEIKL